MEIAILGLSAIVGLVSLACWIWTIVTAFRHGEALIGILCICPLVGFIMGWVKSAEWAHQQVMMVWSGCVVINIVLNVVVSSMGG